MTRSGVATPGHAALPDRHAQNLQLLQVRARAGAPPRAALVCLACAGTAAGVHAVQPCLLFASPYALF